MLQYVGPFEGLAAEKVTAALRAKHGWNKDTIQESEKEQHVITMILMCNQALGNGQQLRPGGANERQSQVTDSNKSAHDEKSRMRHTTVAKNDLR